MNYPEAWQFLDDLQFFKIKLGLDSMAGFLESLGHPQKDLACIHIGGTNGKGSTAVSLLTIFAEAGYKVGMYTSPHLSSVRERFRINDSYISEEEFARLASRIQSVLKGRQITYFEFTTTLAFLWFAEQNVDIALLEVGMGGRLDATNVITPLLSIITNVSMDHEAYLGNTLSEVSREKAGIIKQGVPVVSGVSPDESRDVIVQKAREYDAPLYLLGRDFSCSLEEGGKSWRYDGITDWHYDSLVSGLQGRHQRDNTTLALAALELIQQFFPIKYQIPLKHIRTGLLKAKWPGRFEYISLDRRTGKPLSDSYRQGEHSSPTNNDVEHFILDGAHNPAGVESLKLALEEERSYSSLIGVWASMADKDIANSLLPILPLFSEIIITRPESERSADPAAIQELLPSDTKVKVSCYRSVADALSHAREIAESDDLICVAGSLYLIGAVREILLGDLVP